ncbi:MAG: WbqC family protein [Rikenellaceae bacterium]
MILSTAYFPPIQYIETLKEDSTIIEAHETFQKRSYRNRCDIMTATGIQRLSVPIIGGRGVRLPIREVEVDHSEKFASQHLKSIHTAYRSAPYFEHFIDKIEPLFLFSDKYLFDMNQRITQGILEILKVNTPIVLTENFTGCDTPPIYSRGEYYQVFSERQPFVPNLSILDWIFCNGFLE